MRWIVYMFCTPIVPLAGPVPTTSCWNSPEVAKPWARSPQFPPGVVFDCCEIRAPTEGANSRQPLVLTEVLLRGKFHRFTHSLIQCHLFPSMRL